LRATPVRFCVAEPRRLDYRTAVEYVEQPPQQLVDRMGTVQCWGSNLLRMLGVGDPDNPYTSNVPVTVIGISNARYVNLLDL